MASVLLPRGDLGLQQLCLVLVLGCSVERLSLECPLGIPADRQVGTGLNPRSGLEVPAVDYPRQRHPPSVRCIDRHGGLHNHGPRLGGRPYRPGSRVLADGALQPRGRGPRLLAGAQVGRGGGRGEPLGCSRARHCVLRRARGQEAFGRGHGQHGRRPARRDGRDRDELLVRGGGQLRSPPHAGAARHVDVEHDLQHRKCGRAQRAPG
mmetsp:Transcript_16978/g.59380  ORF Transcript_16978/g.59380 Transcript_16978/m.59380 type:complete len:208 (-) Transcript_16978:1306-1929(-)